MTEYDKQARWYYKRVKYRGENMHVSRNHEGVYAPDNSQDNAVYVSVSGNSVQLSLSEAREVANALLAAVDEYELIASEPDVIEPSIRDQVDALPMGSTFRVNFTDGDVAEYLRTDSGLAMYSATVGHGNGEKGPWVMTIDDPYWKLAISLEVLHLAG